MALLKAELNHARYKRDGLPLRARILSDVDSLGRLGCLTPRLANAALGNSLLRSLMKKTLGLSAKRPLPHYARERFDKWFRQRTRQDGLTRSPIILWDDTFVRYHEPHIGKAAVAVLEALGFAVELVRQRRCCGRPAFSQGNLEEAAKLGAHNLQLLRGTDSPILFLEPSCFSMFKEDYRELNLPETDVIAERCFLFEQFVDDLLAREPEALRFNEQPRHVAIHAHCHAKSLVNVSFMKKLAERLPGREVTLMNTGCCGMAGAFGALESKYDLSLKVGQHLVDHMKAQPNETVFVASGTSCRHQIEHMTPARPLHMAELLADALD
jgi:Fe-S oxidoreductase